VLLDEWLRQGDRHAVNQEAVNQEREHEIDFFDVLMGIEGHVGATAAPSVPIAVFHPAIFS
jgi:hypothetical protein